MAIPHVSRPCAEQMIPWRPESASGAAFGARSRWVRSPTGATRAVPHQRRIDAIRDATARKGIIASRCTTIICNFRSREVSRAQPLLGSGSPRVRQNRHISKDGFNGTRRVSWIFGQNYPKISHELYEIALKPGLKLFRRDILLLRTRPTAFSDAHFWPILARKNALSEKRRGSPLAGFPARDCVASGAGPSSKCRGGTQGASRSHGGRGRWTDGREMRAGASHRQGWNCGGSRMGNASQGDAREAFLVFVIWGSGCCQVAPGGFEPPLEVPKTPVLPLHQGASHPAALERLSVAEASAKAIPQAPRNQPAARSGGGLPFEWRISARPETESEVGRQSGPASVVHAASFT
jgi:hypothetical protein